MREILNKILFEKDVFIRNRFRDDFFKTKHLEYYNYISSMISNEYTFKEKVYIVYYNIPKPVCKICGKKTTLVSFNKGFQTYCSKQCIQKDIEVKNKVKSTNLIKFGFESPQKNSDVRNKTKNTIMNKYGVDNLFKSQIILDKIKETNIKNHGVDNPFKSNLIQNKIKNTNIKKYGVEHNSKVSSVIEKRKKTFLKNYGVDNPNKNEKVLNKRRKTITEIYNTKYSKILNISENDVTSISKGDVEISNLCSKHKSFKISKENLFNRLRYKIENICTICNPIHINPTIKENEICEFLESLNLFFERKNRNILNGKEIDIYIPKNNLGIEFNGLFWHCDKWKDSKYHLNKSVNCQNKSVDLLHVFEDEWVYKKNIVKNIIKSKLGIYLNKIDSCGCSIDFVDKKTSCGFLDENDIGGSDKADLRIGLFKNNILLCLMTLNIKKDNCGVKKYVISRFCTKNDYLVIGGYRKIFDFFINKYNPNIVYGSSNIRYSTDVIFNDLGYINS